MIDIPQLMLIVEDIQRQEVQRMLESMTGHFSEKTQFYPIERGTYLYEYLVINGEECVWNVNDMGDSPSIPVVRGVEIILFFGIMAGYDQELDIMFVWKEGGKNENSLY